MFETATPTRRDPSVPPGTADAGARLAHVLDACGCGLLQVGPDWRIRLVNRAIEEMYGFGRDELIGQSTEILLAPKLRAEHVLRRELFATFPAFRNLCDERRLVGLRRDGVEFPIETSARRLVLDGEAHVLVTIHDISARLAAAPRLERQRQELERINAELTEFAYAVSHDLRAPVRGIALLAEWIAEDLAEIAPPQTLEHCALLRGRAERLRRLLDGLLAYARIGRTKIPAERIDTGALLRDIAASLALPDGFDVEIADGMPFITTERVPLDRVLQNLIENAVKHHDRQRGRICVSAAREGERVRFDVADDGPGIAPRFHRRIFQIFQTLASRDAVEASGIGLAIVKKEVELHGGTITVHSAPPARGTRFTFTWQESPER